MYFFFRGRKTNKMEKEFIPYEQALALKELGFNETNFECFKHWVHYGDYNYFLILPKPKNNYDYISAATFSQVFKWFREKHKINSFISFETIDDSETAYVWNIIKYLPEGKGRKKDTWDFYDRIDSFSRMSWYNNYEEAELACLDKLIEIAENNIKDVS